MSVRGRGGGLPSTSEMSRGLARLEQLLNEMKDDTNRRIDRVNDRVTSESEGASRARDQLSERMDKQTEMIQKAVDVVASLQGAIAPALTDDDGIVGAAKSRFLKKPRMTLLAAVLTFFSFASGIASTGPKVLRAVAALWRASGATDL